MNNIVLKSCAEIVIGTTALCICVAELCLTAGWLLHLAGVPS